MALLSIGLPARAANGPRCETDLAGVQVRPLSLLTRALGPLARFRLKVTRVLINGEIGELQESLLRPFIGRTVRVRVFDEKVLRNAPFSELRRRLARRQTLQFKGRLVGFVEKQGYGGPVFEPVLAVADADVIHVRDLRGSITTDDKVRIDYGADRKTRTLDLETREGESLLVIPIESGIASPGLTGGYWKTWFSTIEFIY